MSTTTNIERQLEELNILNCSLISGESLSFISSDTVTFAWQDLLNAYTENGAIPRTDLQTPAHFAVHIQEAPVWFEVELPLAYPSSGDSKRVSPTVLVRGEEISRSEHERWQAIVKERLVEALDSEYPVYELISTHLLPLLHEDAVMSKEAAIASSEMQTATTSKVVESSTRYHALLTSHHLISPTKRRNLQQWSAQLSITGFAKVGYPGVIYCEGFQEQVEQFVANIKAMQWLALRVRFVEPAPRRLTAQQGDKERRRWTEFEKVGEVVEEMRRLGREKYVVEMGIGSAGVK